MNLYTVVKCPSCNIEHTVSIKGRFGYLYGRYFDNICLRCMLEDLRAKTRKALKDLQEEYHV